MVRCRGQSEVQGVHHGCEGETYRATHVHLCAEEGASFPIYRSTTQSIVTMRAQSLRRMAGIISVSSVGVWPTSSLFGRPFPHRYLQQRAFPCDRRALTPSLFVFQAQRALATRAFQSADPGELTSRLKKGQIEQLTIELQQVSLVQPNTGEAVLAKKLCE